MKWFHGGFEVWWKRAYLAVDVRHFMFGIEWYPSEIDLAFGPIRYEVYR